MKKVIIGIAIVLHLLSVYADENKGRLENNTIIWRWNLSSGKVASILSDKTGGTSFNINSKCFQLMLEDVRTLKSSDFKLVSVPRTVKLPAQVTSIDSPGGFLIPVFLRALRHIFFSVITISKITGCPSVIKDR